MDLILILLASVGLSHILTDGSIVQPIKEKLPQWLKELLNCYQCNGFWSGFTIGVIYLLSSYFPFLIVFLYAFAASYLSMLGAVLLIYFNRSVEDESAGNQTGSPE